MDTDRLPHVPISEFKANPARYLGTGAVVTNHGRPRATFLPVDDPARDADRAESAKATLRLLYRIQSADDVSDELAELSAQRDRDVVDEAR